MELISIIVFIITLLLIITHKINRATAAFLGGLLLMVLGVFPNQMEAIRTYVDFNTIFLLLGMMIFVNVIEKTGIFTYIGIKTLKFTGKNGYTLFIALTFLVALISAFVNNVTTILVFIPITFAITDALKINYFPFILGEIFASNIGGTATLIGDPPNIMIASAANINFNQFARVMAPIAFLNLILMQLILLFLFRKDLNISFDRKFLDEFHSDRIIRNKKDFYLSIVMFVMVIVFFILQTQLKLESCIIALLAGFIALLLFEPKEINQTLKDVEWESIMFFIGLFIITGALEHTGVLRDFSKILVNFAGSSSRFFGTFLLGISAMISGIVDNIPFAATMIPVIKTLPQSSPVIFHDLMPQWYSLILGVCLGGNLTPIGASANIIGLAMISQFKNENVSFLRFTFYGALIVVANIILSMVYVNLFLM